VSSNIFTFSEFYSQFITENLLHIKEEKTIIQQALGDSGKARSTTGATGPSTKSTAGATGGKEDFSKIKFWDLFMATSMGKKIGESFQDNPELLKSLQTRGIVPNDWTIGYQGQKSEADIKADTEAMNQAGMSTSTDTEHKSNVQAIGSGDYKFDDIKKLTWQGLKYILENQKLASKMDFKKYNLIGLRNYLKVKQDYPNKFIDALILMGPESNKELKIMPGTTVPGPLLRVPKERNRLFARTNVMLNSKGVAILQPGVYSYKIGTYRGEPALVQNGPVRVDRYPLVDDINQAKKFTTFSPGNSETGNFGILVHRANSTGTTSDVGNWSAGCIVFATASDLDYVINKMKKSRQNTIDFVLGEMNDIPQKVLASASKIKDNRTASS